MRLKSWRRPELASMADARQPSSGWPQAGYTSFAYRLAHLGLPRPISVAGLCVMFYLT